MRCSHGADEKYAKRRYFQVSVVEMEVPVSRERVAIAAPAQELVVLVHGFAAPSWVLGVLAKHLRNAGYETVIWSYSSFRESLRAHSDRLAEALQRLAARADVKQVHVVAHSMGTIVTRGALRKLRESKIGRVVLMAPPNRGTNWSRWFGPIAKWLIPTVYDLSNAPDSYVNQLPSPDQWYVGIIRADFDFLIPRNSVELSEQMDFISFPALHSGLLFRRDVAEAVTEFLRTGAFPSPAPSETDF
jgi:pimeloyl-ACP methyl ester carboxylesterase